VANPDPVCDPHAAAARDGGQRPEVGGVGELANGKAATSAPSARADPEPPSSVRADDILLND
jgi:hypothetical protein